MAMIECSNSRKRRRTVEPVAKLQLPVAKLRLPAAKKSRSSRSFCTKPNQPDRTSIYASSQPRDRSCYVGKRGRATEDEEPTEHTRKSPRLQENLNKAENRVQPQRQHCRKGPRLLEIRQLNQQKLEHTKKPTRSSLRPIKPHHGVGEEEAQASCRFSRAPRNSKQIRGPKDKSEGQPKLSRAKPKAPNSLKRRRSTQYGDISPHDGKPPNHLDKKEQPRPRTAHGKDEFIKNWLSASCWSRRTSADDETFFQEASDNMPRKAVQALPSPRDSGASTALTSSSRTTEKSVASTRDTDYRKSLRYRNIYIEHQDPPMALMQQAKRIVSRSRTSPEIDDLTAQELRKTARRLQNDNEENLVQQLAPHIVPAMVKVPDLRLERSADQLWFNCVPVPLNPKVLINPLPLPKPKPDLAFGYSEAAFTEDQLTTIDLLVDDHFGRSYAVPDKKLQFPFLDIDFKSQAKNGTHYIATNQVAGAGAAALHGNLELMKRSFGVNKLDYDEPQFFSVTMDHQLACVNVHWLSPPTEDGRHSFHVEGLSKHLLDDAEGLRAVVRAVKNILDYGLDVRLRKLCEALDAYREKVILEREAVATERDQTELQPGQRRRSTEVQLPSHEQQEDQN